MSQIFDALQRNESDRSGTPELSAAKELLEIVERKIGQSATSADTIKRTRPSTSSALPDSARVFIS